MTSRRSWSSESSYGHGFNETTARSEGWYPLTQASAKETDALIVQTIGLSRDTYRDSVYLRQGDQGFADPSRDPRQRKELLVEAVLGRDPIWPRLAEQAKTRRKTSEAALERLTGETGRARELAATRPQVEAAARQAQEAVQGATTAATAAEEELALAQTRLADAHTQEGLQAAAQAEARAADQTLTRLRERQQAAEHATTELESTEIRLRELATAPDIDRLQQRADSLQQAINQHREAARAHETAKQELAGAEHRLADLRGRAHALAEKVEALLADANRVLDHVGTERCDRCDQILGTQAAEKAAASMRAEAAGIADQVVGLVAEEAEVVIPVVPLAPIGEAPVREYETVIGQLRTAQQAAEERARLEERVRQLAETAASGPAPEVLLEAVEAWDAAQAAVDTLTQVDIPALELHEQAARRTVTTNRVIREQALAEQARAAERIDQITAADRTLADAEIAARDLHADIDRDLLLERCYGRDGIPALIIENTAIPYIEIEASRILGLLGSGFQVELRTQAENKTGGLRDTLDVTIIDAAGNEADYADGCSGGEQTRIGLALRIALARLLAHRRGAESRLLALDEPSFLDAAGMEALLGVLAGLEDEFAVILLVSHVAELRDSLDQTIMVVREDGRSRVETSLVEVTV